MNDFYKQPKALVWIESILFLLAGFFLAVLIIEKGSEQPVFYAAFILYVPISQFLYTPFFKLTGGYTYYSPMLLGYMANEKQIDLCWMYSLSRGKVSMPALWDAKKASIQGVALVAQKGKLEALKNHLTDK